MRDSERLIKILKTELRRQNKTYADLAAVLNLSLASIKRLFTKGQFTLTRLEAVCQYLGKDMLQMMQAADEDRASLVSLTLEQELALVSDEQLLCVAHSLLHRWTCDDIVSYYQIDERAVIRFMARLDSMGLIQTLSENRYRLLVSRAFQWLVDGPVQRFFDDQVQTDYFHSVFNKEDEQRIFLNAMLSDTSIATAIAGMGKLLDEINALQQGDENLSLGQRREVCFVLAGRPWELPSFAKLRRH